MTDPTYINVPCSSPIGPMGDEYSGIGYIEDGIVRKLRFVTTSHEYPPTTTYILFLVTSSKKIHECRLCPGLIVLIDVPAIHYKETWKESYSESSPEGFLHLAIHFADPKSLIRWQVKVGSNIVVGSGKLPAMPAPIIYNKIRNQELSTQSSSTFSLFIYSRWSVEFNQPNVSVPQFLGEICRRQLYGKPT